MITIKLALYIIALVHLFFVLLNYIFFLLAIYHKEGIFYKGIFYKYRKNISLLDKEILLLSWMPIFNIFIIRALINKEWKHLKYR